MTRTRATLLLVPALLLLGGTFHQHAFAEPAVQPPQPAPATAPSSANDDRGRRISVQPPEPATAAPPDAKPEANQKPAKRKSCKELVAAAKMLYRQADFRGSIELLMQCYAATRDANMLFNVAQVYRQLDECEGATEYYRRYVQEAPSGERVPQAREFLEGTHCEAAAGADSRLPSVARLPSLPSPPPAAKAEPAPPVPLRSVPPLALATSSPQLRPSNAGSRLTDPWPTIAGVSLGATAMAALSFAYFAVETRSAKRDVEQTVTQPRFDGRYLEGRLDDFYRYRNWAIASAIASGLTAGFSAYAITAAIRAKQERRRQISVAVTPQGTWVGLAWGF